MPGWFCDRCGTNIGFGAMHFCSGGRTDSGSVGSGAVHPPQERPTDDVRAHLWARVYALTLTASDKLDRDARWLAVEAASNAVRDFDEHYLGGKRA